MALRVRARFTWIAFALAAALAGARAKGLALAGQ